MKYVEVPAVRLRAVIVVVANTDVPVAKRLDVVRAVEEARPSVVLPITVSVPEAFNEDVAVITPPVMFPLKNDEM